MPHLLLLLVLVAHVTAADAAPLRVPLAVFGISPGDAVTIDGTAGTAAADGLLLPAGTPVTVTWPARPRPQRQVLTVTSGPGAGLAPAWHSDAVRTDGDTVVSVGSSTSVTIAMALDRAKLAARKSAAQTRATTTTTVEPNGSRTHSSTSAMVSGTITDVAIVVSVDPAATSPVACWVRMRSTVTEMEPTPAQQAAKADLEKALKALDAEMDEQAQKQAPAQPPQ